MVSSWKGPTGLKVDLGLSDLCSKGTPDWVSPGSRSSLDPWKNKLSLVILLNASRSWMIFPMSGAPAVGQKPSPLERTLISDLVNVCFDKLTIPLT